MFFAWNRNRSRFFCRVQLFFDFFIQRFKWNSLENIRNIWEETDWSVSRDSLSFLSELGWFGLGSSSLEKLFYRCISGKLNCDLDRAGRFLRTILPMLLGPQVFSTSRCLGTIELSVYFRPFLVSSTEKTLENQALKRLNFCSLLKAVPLIFFGGVVFLVPSFWELFALVKWLQIILQIGHSSAVDGFLERSLVVSNLQVFPLLVLFDRNRKAVLFFWRV